MYNMSQLQNPASIFDEFADSSNLTDALCDYVSSLVGSKFSCELAWLAAGDNVAEFNKSNRVYLTQNETQLVTSSYVDSSGSWLNQLHIPGHDQMPGSIKTRALELGCESCTIFPLIDLGCLRMLMCCYHRGSNNSISRYNQNAIAMLCRIAAISYSRLENQTKAARMFAGLRDLSRSISLMGPQAKVSDIASEVIASTQSILGTKLVAIYTIDPRVGIVNCSRSSDTSEEITNSFEEVYGQIISDRDQRDALVHTIPIKHSSSRYGAQKSLQEHKIRSIAAAPIRSEVGISGALIAFFEWELMDFDAIAQTAESIADTASVAMSFAFTLEQSHWLLDDLAGTNLELFTQASEDALTGLNNHRFLQQALAQMCQSRRAKNVFSFIMADVDFFKRYNDTYGHLGGDVVLRKLALILTAEIRQVDLVARYGGEEFGIILRGTGKEEAIEVAERIREAIAISNCGKTQITLSMGIATFPQDASSPGELVSKADQALYKAKRAGRNRVCNWIEDTEETIPTTS